MEKPLKLIIADDEAYIRSSLKQLFPWEEMGYEVLSSFSNGLAALNFLEQHPVDVLLTDIRMPVMDGLEAARRIRASNHPRAKEIPILALTANGLEEDNREILEAGMNRRLSKPLSVTALYESIQYYVKGKDA